MGALPGMTPEITDLAGYMARGHRCWSEGRALDALAAFEAAWQMAPLNGLAASWYGRLLMEQRGLHRRAVAMCHEGVKLAPDEMETHANLAVVLVAAGERAAAVEGLRLAAARFGAHHQLGQLLEMVGIRRKPMFAALPRSHPVNRYLGMLTWRLGMR